MWNSDWMNCLTTTMLMTTTTMRKWSVHWTVTLMRAIAATVTSVALVAAWVVVVAVLHITTFKYSWRLPQPPCHPWHQILRHRINRRERNEGDHQSTIQSWMRQRRRQRAKERMYNPRRRSVRVPALQHHPLQSCSLLHRLLLP